MSAHRHDLRKDFSPDREGARQQKTPIEESFSCSLEPDSGFCLCGVQTCTSFVAFDLICRTCSTKVREEAEFALTWYLATAVALVGRTSSSSHLEVLKLS